MNTALKRLTRRKRMIKDRRSMILRKRRNDANKKNNKNFQRSIVKKTK